MPLIDILECNNIFPINIAMPPRQKKSTKPKKNRPKRHGRGEFRIDPGFYINPRYLGGFRMQPIKGSGFWGTVSALANVIQQTRDRN